MAVSIAPSLVDRELAIAPVCDAARALLDRAQAATCYCLASCLAAGAIESWAELLPGGTARIHSDEVAAAMWRLERRTEPLVRSLAAIATRREGTSVAVLTITRRSAWILDDILLLTTPDSFRSPQRNAVIYPLSRRGLQQANDDWHDLVSGIASGQN